MRTLVIVGLIFCLAAAGEGRAGAGDKVYTIVIDPGHGGKDPGALGASGRMEKKVVLAISKKLKSQLERLLPSRVILTRKGDAFLSLAERNRISKKAKADLFISIHANASPRREANGFEIYYLNNATDRASEKLAVRENQGIPEAEKDLAAILSTMIQNESTEESAVLARSVRREVFKKLKAGEAKDLRIKTALFYVLVGPGCPSLLIETGFITHPAEGKRLTEARYQERMATGIAQGIQSYLEGSRRARSNL